MRPESAPEQPDELPVEPEEGVEVIQQLDEELLSADEWSKRQERLHRLISKPPTKKKQDPRLACVNCRFHGRKRKDSRTICKVCNPQRGFCTIECLQDHHHREGIFQAPVPSSEPQPGPSGLQQVIAPSPSNSEESQEPLFLAPSQSSNEESHAPLSPDASERGPTPSNTEEHAQSVPATLPPDNSEDGQEHGPTSSNTEESPHAPLSPEFIAPEESPSHTDYGPIVTAPSTHSSVVNELQHIVYRRASGESSVTNVEPTSDEDETRPSGSGGPRTPPEPDTYTSVRRPKLLRSPTKSTKRPREPSPGVTLSVKRVTRSATAAIKNQALDEVVSSPADTSEASSEDNDQ